MQRALPVIIAFHWAALFCLGGIIAIADPGLRPGSSIDLVLVGSQAFAQLVAATVFFYALSTLLAQRQEGAPDRMDVGRIAIGAGLIATTIGMLASIALGRVDHLVLPLVQFAGLLLSHLVWQSERPVVAKRTGANDNSRATARLLAMLASSDARMNRIVAASRPGASERRP